MTETDRNIMRAQSYLANAQAQLGHAVAALGPVATVPAEARVVERVRTRRAWRPEQVYALRSELSVHPMHEGKTIPLANLDGVRIIAPESSALNGGFKVSTGKDGPLTLLWQKLCVDVGMGWDQRKIYFMDYTNEHEEELFIAPVPAYTWNEVEIAAKGWYNTPHGEWDPKRIASHWLDRDYCTDHTTYSRCYFHHSGGHSKDGHATYKNVYGDVTYWQCLFDELGGQATQLVDRSTRGDAWKASYENGNLMIKPKIENRRPRGGTINYLQCIVGETGYADGRGSFAHSVAGIGSPEALYDVNFIEGIIECRWPIPGGKYGNRSRGGILVEAADQHDWSYGRVVVQKYDVRLWRPDRPVIAINNARYVEVTGNEFVVEEGHGNLYIDRRDFEGFEKVKNCGEVYWSGNSGNMDLVVAGQKIGPCTGTYTFKDGKLA